MLNRYISKKYKRHQPMSRIWSQVVNGHTRLPLAPPPRRAKVDGQREDEDQTDGEERHERDRAEQRHERLDEQQVGQRRVRVVIQKLTQRMSAPSTHSQPGERGRRHTMAYEHLMKRFSQTG